MKKIALVLLSMTFMSFAGGDVSPTPQKRSPVTEKQMQEVKGCPYSHCNLKTGDKKLTDAEVKKIKGCLFQNKPIIRKCIESSRTEHEISDCINTKKRTM